MNKKFLTFIILAGTLLLSGCASRAEDPADWPTKGVEVKIAYTAGGTADTANRQLAAIMGEDLGQTFNLVNVTGGSGSIAGQQVLSAAADGYTWLGDVAHTVSGFRVLDYADMGWEDFYGFYAATSPYVLFVSGNSEYDTYDELFEAMKADPNMKWGNAGLGSINQLTGQLMVDTMGLSGNSVPYDGGRAAAVKVVANEVVWSWCGVSDVIDLAESGDIKLLGVCDAEPLTIETPEGSYEVPSMLDEYPELESLQGLLYWGFRIPRDTPAEVVKKIDEAFQKAIETPEWADFCASKGLEPVEMTGTESDEMCARLESIYCWGLYDIGMAPKSPEEFEIPRIEDFEFPANDRAAEAQAWPE